MVVNLQFLMKFIIAFTFFVCYLLIIFEEKIMFKKSEISIFFSGIMLIILFVFFYDFLKDGNINTILNDVLLKYCELFLFLIVAMAYINVLKYFKVLDFIKYFILLNRWSSKKLFFLTGVFSFFMSPFADNLTTSLFMVSVILCVESEDKTFISISCANIVVAANAGGTFTPFGDITTLMIWQSGMVDFFSFFKLFLPAFLSFLVPSTIMCLYIKNVNINYAKISSCFLCREAKIVFLLFILTIFISVFFQSYLKISSAIGMMCGFSFLQIYVSFVEKKKKINLIDQIVKIELEVLFFFYGIMLCVGCLNLAGILTDVSEYLYDNNIFPLEYKYIIANILIGLFSAFIDNIPVTFSIISMNPSMDCEQWLLMTLAVAIGGSIFSIGSAAGIAVMGISNGNYTFLSHLKWSFVILLGYFIGILSYIFLNI